MVENVNKKIIEKIKNSSLDENVKDFLKDILRTELRHVPGWRFGTDYERIIMTYVEKAEAKNEI